MATPDKIPLQAVIGVICDCLSDLSADDQRRALEGVGVALGLGSLGQKPPDPTPALSVVGEPPQWDPPQWDAERTRWIEERVARAREQVQQAQLAQAPDATAPIAPAHREGFRLRRWFEHGR